MMVQINDLAKPYRKAESDTSAYLMLSYILSSVLLLFSLFFFPVVIYLPIYEVYSLTVCIAVQLFLFSFEM